MADCDEELTLLSVLTLGEIQKGNSKPADKKRHSSLQTWLDSGLRPRFGDWVLSNTQDISQAWGGSSSGVGGQVLPAIDALIGATATTRNMTVVTGNVSVLVKNGARILNPWNSWFKFRFEPISADGYGTKRRCLLKTDANR